MASKDDAPERRDRDRKEGRNSPDSRSSRLVHLNFRRRPSRKFPSKSELRVLLLQGPVGPFFKKAQAHLNANGFDAWRVCFNAGDRLFSRSEKTLNFSGSRDAWQAWFSEFVIENAFDYVVLFGCERVAHRVAIDCCHENGIPVLCLEEGYLRPGYVTMEFGGNNWRSPIAGQLAPEKISASSRDSGKVTAYPSSFGAMATFAFLYFSVRGLFSTVSERKLFHKQKRTLVSEGFYWLKNYYRKFRNLGHNYRLVERLLEDHDNRYFLIPLQVHDDSQLGQAAGSWNNQKLILKSIVSFARNAPPGYQLVFKIHPMERGHSRDGHFIRQVSALNNVAERVHILDGGSMGLLTRHAAGMVTINSTSGLSAIFHGVPLAVMGHAIYRNPELAFCVRKGIELDEFWTGGKTASYEVRRNYLSWLTRESLQAGDFYVRDGMELATAAVLELLKGKAEKKSQSVPVPAAPARDRVVTEFPPGRATRTRT
ncbi:hypothetical protein [Sinorhizobium sp. BG8]|uniref:capsular polysaccharide export protein, LipB/KpsS family n=1 Tax=Sinorhizobium sp. BG8 TaxID=2613773 RepID=UPI00193D1711|nr:hypothetical protein [Sinorhizobium sp. BG8]QRM56525.1 hypothetical protein F3Y30_19790 [Sinorhizobium sp. BG8]